MQEKKDVGLIPGLGRSPGEGHGNPFQYSCLDNPMDRGDWWATVHGVSKNQTWLKQLIMQVCTHILSWRNISLTQNFLWEMQTWKRIIFSSDLKVLNHFKIKSRYVACNQELQVLVGHGSPHQFDELELLYRQPVHINRIVSEPQR